MYPEEHFYTDWNKNEEIEVNSLDTWNNYFDTKYNYFSEYPVFLTFSDTISLRPVLVDQVVLH